MAASSSGGYQAGMGVACADFDGDGLVDLAVTNFYAESTSLYQNLGGGLFTDRTAAAGLSAATRFVLGFGLTALDANNDGYPDLAQANGHVADFRPAVPYAMPAQLLLNDGSGRFTDVSEHAGVRGKSLAWHEDWQPVTSITMDAPTSSWSPRTLRSPYFAIKPCQ